MNIFEKTISTLQIDAARHDSILVSYSGGKDSLIVLDLCVRSFQKVVCFFMYLIPELTICETQLQYARDCYGVEILEYPHWLLVQLLKNGVYCDSHYIFDKLGYQSPKDIYALVREDTGIDLIATGMKKNDSIFRRRNLSKEQLNVIHPIQEWNKFQVMAYLRQEKIPLPASAGGNVSGIDLTDGNILWLHDNYPEDFKKLCKIFSYAEVPVYRRMWYGKQKRTSDSKKS